MLTARDTDGDSIHDISIEYPNHEGLNGCTLFQLSPVQRVFRGVIGRGGWRVDTDKEAERETLAFGDAADGATGISLTLMLNETSTRTKGLLGTATARQFTTAPPPGYPVQFIVPNLESWREGEVLDMTRADGWEEGWLVETRAKWKAVERQGSTGFEADGFEEWETEFQVERVEVWYEKGEDEDY
jgi:hypothetical protein